MSAALSVLAAIPGAIAIPNDETLMRAGVTVERYGFWVSYKGAKAVIIATGLLADGWFPGDPGQNKTHISFRKLRGIGGNACDRPDFGALASVQRLSKIRFEVCREATKEERAAREAAAVRENRAYEARERLNRAQASESVSIDAMASSHEEFRKRVEHFLLTARFAARCPDGGYRFDAEAWDAFDEAMTAVEEVVARGIVEFSPALRAKKIAEIKAETAKADTGLQSFLNALVDVRGGDEHVEAQP